MPTALANLPRVAFLPADALTVGWMWMMPPPLPVVIPSGFLAWVMAGRNLPHAYTAYPSFQVVPTVGAVSPCPLILASRVSRLLHVPATPITTPAAMTLKYIQGVRPRLVRPPPVPAARATF